MITVALLFNQLTKTRDKYYITQITPSFAVSQAINILYSKLTYRRQFLMRKYEVFFSSHQKFTTRLYSQTAHSGHWY